MDTFELLLLDVGRPLFLLVRSDGLSRKPTWYMDFAELTNAMIPPTFFVAGACAAAAAALPAATHPVGSSLSLCCHWRLAKLTARHDVRPWPCTLPLTGPRPPGLWVGPETGLEIRIPASYMDPRVDRAEYLVQVFTSDVK